MANQYWKRDCYDDLDNLDSEEPMFRKNRRPNNKRQPKSQRRVNNDAPQPLYNQPRNQRKQRIHVTQEDQVPNIAKELFGSSYHKSR